MGEVFFFFVVDGGLIVENGVDSFGVGVNLSANIFSWMLCRFSSIFNFKYCGVRRFSDFFNTTV